MQTETDWPWERSLALARPATPVQIERILFGIVRDRCSELGIREGSIVTCLRRDERAVDVELQDGARGRVSREHAWFILVGTAH